MSSSVGMVIQSLTEAWYRGGRQTWIRANQSSFKNVLFYNHCWKHSFGGLPPDNMFVEILLYIVSTSATAVHCKIACMLFVYSRHDSVITASWNDLEPIIFSPSIQRDAGARWELLNRLPPTGFQSHCHPDCVASFFDFFLSHGQNLLHTVHLNE